LANDVAGGAAIVAGEDQKLSESPAQGEIILTW
jgi:hypothetical protein